MQYQAAGVPTQRRPQPQLPPHVLERHRRVLAGILHKRLLIEEWRKEVGGAMDPSDPSRSCSGPRTYQSRLREQFVELREVLPERLRPGAAARVAIMENAMNYIIDLKNSMQYLTGGGEAMRRPSYQELGTDNVTATQLRNQREKATLKMLSEVVPGVSGRENRIQLLEHAKNTIRALEVEYQRLVEDQRREQAYSSSGSDYSTHISGRPIHGERLPSIHEILHDQSPLDDLQLPPLRMYYA
ncbi:hypothetical protein CYLTODRAFT_416836 [Cylindrobasidium torrendii FP15055 ss-10]|uniref:BHLH domain-containing protein n=1 Tax=Cylindrobasidium torrendii FP15055 ss-10 TaxID=1314674 RepID=A0A0D7BTG0_9AGAR|nr:hypothetical protein CYLTODRAFT_416836 [Cylindrobasidium torrendii FP15055 ss-10]